MTATESRAARDEGMRTAERGANPDWCDHMRALIEKVAREKEFFTSDDVFELLDADPFAPDTPDNRAFGPVIARAAKDGVCEKTDRVVPSTRVRLHAGNQRVWKSLTKES